MHVDLVVTNPTHHMRIVDALASELDARGHSCRVLSLCEVRGWPTPIAPLESGAPVIRLIPPLRRSEPHASGEDEGRSRQWLKTLVWKLLIAPALRRAHRKRPADVVVTCNEHAFPNDHVLDWYGTVGVARVLVPEGIRFAAPSPGAAERIDAVAAWGPSSVDYFVRAGFRPEGVHAAGSPRHDQIQRELADLRARATARDENTIAVITNPIDGAPLHLCTTTEKLDVVVRFVDAALAADASRQIIVRTHPGEDAATYRARLAESLRSGRVTLNPPGDLFELLARTPVVVVLGSTVGIEALLAGASLFVLPIPGRGYLHDFVQGGGAIGLEDPMPAEQARSLFAPAVAPDQTAQYLDSQLSNRGAATAAVADVICAAVPRAGAR